MPPWFGRAGYLLNGIPATQCHWTDKKSAFIRRYSTEKTGIQVAKPFYVVIYSQNLKMEENNENSKPC